MDNINFSNLQWVAVSANVMGTGACEERDMTLLTMNSPEKEGNFSWHSKVLGGLVPRLLKNAFPRAALRYNKPAPVRHQHANI